MGECGFVCVGLFTMSIYSVPKCKVLSRWWNYWLHKRVLFVCSPFHKCKERDVLSVISSTDIIWSTWGRYLCLITVSLSEGHAAPHCSFSAAFHVEYKWNTDRWAFSGLIKDSHLMLLSATDRLIQAANTGGSKGLSGKFEAGDGGSQSKRFSADPRLSQGWLMSLEISKGTITKCTTGVLLQTEDITLSKFTFNVVL